MQGIKSHVSPEITGNFYVSDFLLKRSLQLQVHCEKKSCYLRDHWIWGRFKPCCKWIPNLSCWLQRQGNRAFPKHQVRKRRALPLQEVCVSTTRREGKWGEHTARISPSLGSSGAWAQMTIVTTDPWGRKDLGRCPHQCNMLLPPLQWVLCSFSCLQFVGSWAFLNALHSSRCLCFL